MESAGCPDVMEKMRRDGRDVESEREIEREHEMLIATRKESGGWMDRELTYRDTPLPLVALTFPLCPCISLAEKEISRVHPQFVGKSRARSGPSRSCVYLSTHAYSERN